MALSLLHQSQISSTTSQLAYLSSAAFGNGDKVELSNEAQLISCGSSIGTGNGTTSSRTLRSNISSSSSSSSSSNASTATKFVVVPHAHRVHSPQPLLRPAPSQQATLLQWQAPSLRKKLPLGYRAWQGSAKGGRGGRPTEGNRGEEGKTGGEASKDEKREVERERTGEEKRKGVEGADLGNIVGSDIALSSLWYMDPKEGSNSDPASAAAAAAAAGAALTAEGSSSQPTGAGTEPSAGTTGSPASKSSPSQQPGAAAAAVPPLSPFASAASAAAAASSVPPTQYVPPDPVWRDVFPSYMQSREHTDDVITSAAAASTFPPQQQQLPPQQRAPSPAGFDRWVPGRPYADINGIGGSVGNGVGSVGGGSGGGVGGVPGSRSTAGNGRPDASAAHLHPSFSEPSLTQPSPPGPSGAAPGYQGPGFSNGYQGVPNGSPRFDHGGRSNGSSSGPGDFGSVYGRSEEGYSSYASSAASSQSYPFPRSPSPMGVPGPQPGLGVGVGHQSVDYVWGPGFGGGGGGGGSYASNDPIWAAIRAEAKLEAEQEPILSSFLYASILAHDCFERSLGFVLANRLKNVTLLATQLMDVFDDVLMQPDIRVAIRADVQAVRDRDPSCRSYSCALLYYKGYHALQSYRIAHALWCRGQHILALALQSRISEVFAVDIHPAARIGRGILMDHGTGVVIGETAVIGDRVSLLQGVTLGGTGKEAGDRHPKIQEGVLIGAGATILGNIVIGRGSMVAAGALVLKSVPAHSMVAGSPAKIVGTLKEPTPALTMQHNVTTKYCEDWEASQQQQRQQIDSPDKKRLP